MLFDSYSKYQFVTESGCIENPQDHALCVMGPDLFLMLKFTLLSGPHFLRTLHTNFRPLGASKVTAGTLGLAGRQGISTHLYPSANCLFTASM